MSPARRARLSGVNGGYGPASRPAERSPAVLFYGCWSCCFNKAAPRGHWRCKQKAALRLKATRACSELYRMCGLRLSKIAGDPTMLRTLLLAVRAMGNIVTQATFKIFFNRSRAGPGGLDSHLPTLRTQSLPAWQLMPENWPTRRLIRFAVFQATGHFLPAPQISSSGLPGPPPASPYLPGTFPPPPVNGYGTDGG
jgi:hypothetical protein